MSVEAHRRLEQLKDLLNFQDDGAFQQYCNGYLQAERDVGDRIKRLTEVLEKIKHDDRKSRPCPDNKFGCAVLHFTNGPFSEIARKALEDDST